MEFEVITTVATDCPISYASTPVSIITPPNNDEFDFNDGTVKKEYHVFKAHRVIVASRCEYLRKALLSGMQEDINRYEIIGCNAYNLKGFRNIWILRALKINVFLMLKIKSLICRVNYFEDYIIL